MQREGIRRSEYVLGRSLRRLWGLMREMSRMLEAAHSIGNNSASGSAMANYSAIANYEWEPLVTEMPAGEALVIYFELPGVERQDIDLSLYGNSIVLSGIRKELPSLRNVTVEEIASGGLDPGSVRYLPFKRSVELPKAVSEEDVEAVFGAGLLQVRVAEAVEDGTRRIHIRGRKRSQK